MVKTPSCATNVSDRSRLSLFGVVIICMLLSLGFPLETELFLLLSCAVAPTVRTLGSTDSMTEFLSISFGLVCSVLPEVLTLEVVEVAELLLLEHGDSMFQCRSSITCTKPGKCEQGKQTLRKSGLCNCSLILE